MSIDLPVDGRYLSDRREMVPYVPRDAVRVLDVGCATGRFGTTLVAAGHAGTLWGIDPAAPEECPAYERMIRGEFPAALPPGAEFDCIIFNDVLEHMIDPWAAVAAAVERLAEGGTVLASIPNVRNVRLVTRMVFSNEWTYADTGVLDRTHLRFFTSTTMRQMFESAGLSVVTLEPLNLPSRGRRGLLRKATFGLLDGWLAEQFAVVATAGAPAIAT